MADHGTSNFRVPPEMRSLAEQSVAQAKQAFDGFMNAARGAVSTFEERTAAVQAGAKDVQRKAVTFAERNVDASFDFARRLLAAEDTAEMMNLHAEYVKSQIEAFTQQASELGETVSQTARVPKN